MTDAEYSLETEKDREGVITLSNIINELDSYLVKKEKYEGTYPAELIIIYRDSKLIDITFTKYPDSETARMSIKDIIKEFKEKSEEICNTKQILEWYGKTYILAASEKCDTLMLFRSISAWKAPIIGNWLISLANILAEDKIIAHPILLANAIRFIIKNQNKMTPDNYSRLILKLTVKADKIYPILQGSYMMIKSALRAISIKLGDALAELGEKLIEEGYLTGDKTIFDIAKETNSNLINVLKILIEFEARGIVAL